VSLINDLKQHHDVLAIEGELSGLAGKQRAEMRSNSSANLVVQISALFDDRRQLSRTSLGGRGARTSLLQPAMFAAAMGTYPIIKTGEPVLDDLVTDAMYDPELAVISIAQGRRPSRC
jgi:hypothetical protein